MIDLWQHCAVALLAFALIGVVPGAEAALTDWFAEDAESFATDESGRWNYKPGSASTNANQIVVTEGALTYTPATAAGGEYIVGEHAVTFGSAAMSYDESVADAVGLQLVENDDGAVFAVVSPTANGYGWLATSVAGELDTEYVIRIEQDYNANGRVVRYFFKLPSASAFTPIATVSMSAAARVPATVVHEGKGSIRTMVAQYAAEDPDPYNRWVMVGGLLTWAGQGGSSAAPDAKSSNAIYKEWVKVGETWQDGSSLVGAAAFTAHPQFALRFVQQSGVVPLTIGCAFSPFDLAGLMVEPDATGYSIKDTSQSSHTTRLGSLSGGVSWFVVNESFSIYRQKGPVVFYGQVNLDIAENQSFKVNPNCTTYPTKLDAATNTRLKFHGKGYLYIKYLDATGTVTLDYSDLPSGTTGESCLKGSITIDSSTAFVLPSSVKPGDKFKLCSGTVTGGGTTPVMHSVTVGENTYAAKVTISNGNQLSYEISDYSRFAQHPGVFTWASSATRLVDGVFRRFDCSLGTDADDTYVANSSYQTVPGWENVLINQFWWIFADDYVSAGNLPFAKGALYALRFAGNQGTGALLTLPQTSLSFGSLIVESGAFGYGFTNSTPSRISVGADLANITNRIEVTEDFKLGSVNLELKGHVALSVAAGKTLQVTGAAVTTATNASERTTLDLVGEGALKADRLYVSGAATLDLSQQSTSRQTPFIDAALTLSPLARIVFPLALTEDTAFTLCSGELTASDGVYAVARGATGEFFLANLTFNKTQHTVSYRSVSSSIAVDLSSSPIKWSDIKSKIVANQPLVFTLTKNVQLNMDTAGVSIPNLLVLGNYKLSIVQINAASIDALWLGRKSKAEVVINQSGTLFGKAYEVPSAVAYETVIEGSSTLSSPALWQAALKVEGRLTTRNHLYFASESDTTDSIVWDEGAVLTVSSGGSVQYEPAYPLTGVVVNLNGEWSLGDAEWQPGAGLKLNLGSSGHLSGSTEALMSVADLVKFSVSGKATLGVPMMADLPVACKLESSAELAVEAAVANTTNNTGLAVYGAGLVRNQGVDVGFSEKIFAAGGLYGSGVASFCGDPSASGVTNSLRNASRWTGVCALVGAELADFNPDDFGSESSVVRLSGCSGYFAPNVTAENTTLEMAAATEDYPTAMDIDNGYDGNRIILKKLSGSGSLVIRANGTERYRVFLPTLRNFSGSLSVVGVNTLSAFVLGDTDSLEQAEILTNDDYDGTILAYAGDTTMSSASVWSAVGGICINAGATVIDGGKLTSPVRGSGTIKYSEGMRAWQPESAAKLTDDSTWSGTVHFDALTLYGANLSLCGNAKSKIKLSAVEGWLNSQVIASTVEMVNSGFTVTEARAGAEVVIDSLVGNGSFTFDAGITASDWSFRLMEVNDYEGTLTLDSELGSVLIGSAARSDNGIIAVEDGYYLLSQRDWKAPAAVFGDTLTVEGEVGDSLFKVTGGDVEFESIALTLVNGDPRRNYQLKYDADSQSIMIAAASTPPTAKVQGVTVRYGVDLTEVYVSVDISDYWSGYDFDGRTLAEVYIYDANGNVVGYRSAEITGDGTNEIGLVDLPNGRDKDYRYEVRVITDGSSTTGELIDAYAVEASSVREESLWIHENAASYKSASRSRKTGDWDTPYSAQVSTADNTIDIVSSGDNGDRIKFKPYRESTNEVVEISNTVVFRGAYDEAAVPVAENPINRVAALTLVQLPGADEELAYSGWVCDDANENGGYFETLFGKTAPQIGVETKLAWTINYHTGFIVYSADGVVLTNAAGASHFALSAQRQLRGNSLAYRGTAILDEVLGSEWNGNLARVVDKESHTNEYESIEAAVAAAVAGGVTNVTLLWDASWKPSASDLGRTFVFESDAAATEKFKLVIDSTRIEELRRGGYQVIDNGNGSYTIDVIKYSISFEANGGNGEMADQYYSVTNMIFNLAPNEFVREGKDFDVWTLDDAGKGEERWADGAEIDMNEFGLTNLTLYAQWRVAVRTIVIEPADEFVYIEKVVTNGVVHSGVRYFGTELSEGRGRAEFSLTHGSDLVVYYSTDLEKSLTFDFIHHRLDWTGQTIAYAEQPVLGGELLSFEQRWAANNCISLTALSVSPYSKSSALLDLSSLLKETSEVKITDFAVTESGCTFKVFVDGEALSSAAAIAPMIKITSDLNGNWSSPTADAVTVAADGTVSVKITGSGNFVKIVIPKN